jgi:decaprenylphospho-beta-D-erythro-pentofuranosid-2-ulose 2-reductase
MCVLILGATSPIAAAIAKEYAKQQKPIALAGRNLELIQELAQDIQIRYAVECEAFEFDALKLDQHAQLLKNVKDRFQDIEVAVLAFAEMSAQEDAQNNVNVAKRMIDINYTGSVSMCEQLAQYFEQESQLENKSIVVISSVAGEKGRKSNYIYGSTKGALNIYLQGLRNRLFSSKIQVLTAILGFVDTPMTQGLKTPIPIASPEKTAQAIVEAQQAGDDILYYPRFWRGIMSAIKGLPEFIFKRTSI